MNTLTRLQNGKDTHILKQHEVLSIKKELIEMLQDIEEINSLLEEEMEEVPSRPMYEAR